MPLDFPGCQHKHSPQGRNLPRVIQGLAAPKDQESLKTFPKTIPEGGHAVNLCERHALGYLSNHLRTLAKKFGYERGAQAGISRDPAKYAPGSDKEPIRALQGISTDSSTVVNGMLVWSSDRTNPPYIVWFYKRREAEDEEPVNYCETYDADFIRGSAAPEAEPADASYPQLSRRQLDMLDLIPDDLGNALIAGHGQVSIPDDLRQQLRAMGLGQHPLSGRDVSDSGDEAELVD